MNTRNLLLSVLVLLSIIILIGCSESVSPAPDIPIETLLAAPQSLEIGNQTIKLSTKMYRDFMPVIGGSNSALFALAYIETADSTVINPYINSETVYFVYNGKSWIANFNQETAPSPELKPFRIVKVLRNGPSLNTGIYVDVIVKIKVNNLDYLLRAEKQFVQRLD